MSRRLCLLLPLLTSACMEAAPPAQRSGNDGVADKLALGVTKAEVDTALGIEAGFERNPANWDESCASYAYGGDRRRYVHAVFEDGVLTRASDGHGTICTYGASVGV